MTVLILCVSIFSIVTFIVISALRFYTAKNQAKRYGMRKEITDPITYWISMISAIVIIVVKVIQIYKRPLFDDMSFWEILLDLGPSILLLVFSRTIGRSVILRAEKKIYMSNLIAQTEDIDAFMKKDNKWILKTRTGEYPVSLTNTTVIRVADITGAKVIKNDK